MITSSMKRLVGATLSIGLVAALTVAPVTAAPVDLFPATQPLAEQATSPLPEAGQEFARRGRGADDAPGHVRGGGKGRGRGADDGPNHTWINDAAHDLQFARRGRGADDAPGHVRGGGKGRGADDAPNHG